MIEFDRVDSLTEPILLASFEGWNDAAESASGALAHLGTVWDARLIGELDPDDYYDFQVNRPTIAADAAAPTAEGRPAPGSAGRPRASSWRSCLDATSS